MLPQSYDWTLLGDLSPVTPPTTPEIDESIPIVKSADVWARDYLEVNFSRYMVNNTAMQSIGSYSIEPKFPSQANPVSVTRVRPHGTSLASTVFLIITPFTVGQEYTITVSTSLITSNNINLSNILNKGKFVGRYTKIDSVLDTRPSWYDLDPDSTFRIIVNAMFRVQDLASGSRKDRLP